MKIRCTNRVWLPILAVVGLAGHLAAADAELIAKGRELFQAKICTTCHQVPGGPPALAEQRWPNNARPMKDERAGESDRLSRDPAVIHYEYQFGN